MTYGSGLNGTYTLRGTSFSRHPGTGVELLEVKVEDARGSEVTYRFTGSDGRAHSRWDGARFHPMDEDDFPDVYRVLDSAGFFGNKGLDHKVGRVRGAMRKYGSTLGLVPMAERADSPAASIDTVVASSVRPYLTGDRTVLVDESPTERANFARQALGLPKLR